MPAMDHSHRPLLANTICIFLQRIVQILRMKGYIFQGGGISPLETFSYLTILTIHLNPTYTLRAPRHKTKLNTTTCHVESFL